MDLIESDSIKYRLYIAMGLITFGLHRRKDMRCCYIRMRADKWLKNASVCSIRCNERPADDVENELRSFPDLMHGTINTLHIYTVGIMLFLLSICGIVFAVTWMMLTVPLYD